MFGFGKPARDPLADVKSAQRWLASFTTSDPLALYPDIVKVVERVSEPKPDRHTSEVEALFHVDAYARDVRAALTRQYVEHAAHSAKAEPQLWQALFELARAFQVAYAACERDALDREQDPKWQALLPELFARQILQHAADGKIRMFRYEQWIPAKWAELNQRFALARSRSITRRRLMLAGMSVPITIEHAYVTTLVLHLCNAGNLDPRALDWLTAHLDNWCSSLRLSTGCPGPTAFYVDLAERYGLRRRSAAPLEGPVLFLDTEPLNSLLRHYIIAVEQKIRSQPLSPRTAGRIERLALLTKLAAQTDPDFRPLLRRGERTAVAGRVEAIVGLGNISGYLHHEEHATVPELDTVGSFSGTLDLAIFGRMRNEEERRKELARRRLEAFAASGGPWEMKDVSVTGLRVVAPMTAATNITLGMPVALRGEGEIVWRLGIVRRMKRLTGERAEIGLQRIADSITNVKLRSVPQPRPPELIDLDAVPERERLFDALFLAFQQRDQGGVIQSLIVPGADYQVGKRLRLESATGSYPVRLGSLIERHPDWVWLALEAAPVPEVREDASAERG